MSIRIQYKRPLKLEVYFSIVGKLLGSVICISHECLFINVYEAFNYNN